MYLLKSVILTVTAVSLLHYLILALLMQGPPKHVENKYGAPYFIDQGGSKSNVLRKLTPKHENIKRHGRRFLQPRVLKRLNPCKERGVLTVDDGGRLGNLISQYATLYGHSRRLGVKAVLSNHMSHTLGRIFPRLSIPISLQSEKLNCSWNFVTVDVDKVNRDVFKNGTVNVRIGGYPADLPVFHQFRSDLTEKEFYLDTGLSMAVRMFLRKVQRKHKAQIYVGVHVRRTDYAVWLKNKVDGRLLTKQYYVKAMDYFRKQNDQVVFVVASDDNEWCKDMFSNMSDVAFTQVNSGSNRPEYDLAVLAHCNHSIIGYGTFAFWSAYLKPKGQVIMASGFSSKPTPLLTDVQTSLKTWILMNDPCYVKPDNKNASIHITQECWQKRHEYGLPEYT